MADKQCINDDCGITLKALKSKCLSEFDITVGLSTINRCIAIFSYTFKRVHYIPERRNSPDVIEKRKLYAEEFM
ncbi:hypothetical protein ENBRE01_2193 [Enteropsectra breve]|nr:hypothetical protein ENBRE01_2193 [Enteropsectra breve]